MQRASYSDRNTISVLDSDRHVVFDFTSKVIEFFVTTSGNDGEVTFLLCLQLAIIVCSKDLLMGTNNINMLS